MSTNSSTGFRPATSVYMRGQVYVPQIELQTLNVEIIALRAENERLREATKTTTVDALLANGRLREERDQLRELFKKYMNHVAAEEGSTFMPYKYDGFSAEEIETLEALNAEARTLAKEARK
jgi:hypothetical protein